MLRAGIQVPSFITSTAFFNIGPIYRFIQRLIWHLTGVQAARVKATTCYEQCVHVQKIIWRRKVSSWLSGDTSSFLATHESFDHPKILLDPSVSLFGLTASEAVFVKTDSAVDIYSSDTHAYMKWPQAENAEMVYTIPLEAFHQLAEEIGDPKLPIIWIWNIGRCGSTLLGQVFEQVPGTVLLGEPDALMVLSFQSKSEIISREEELRLLRSVIRLQCKELPGASRIVLKVAAFTFAEVKDVHDMFPSIRHMFLYRDSLPYAKSSKALSQSELTGRVIKRFVDSDIFFKIFPGLRTRLYRNCVRVDRNDHDLEVVAPTLTFIGHWVVLAAAIMNRYRKLLNEGMPIFAILYEDLISEKEHMVRQIFIKLDIPEKYVKRAVTAFDVDSQRGSPLSKKSLGSRHHLTPRELSEANKVLAAYGFPPCGERMDLPGRILPYIDD